MTQPQALVCAGESVDTESHVMLCAEVAHFVAAMQAINIDDASTEQRQAALLAAVSQIPDLSR